jgi:hypothetical protein
MDEFDGKTYEEILKEKEENEQREIRKRNQFEKENDVVLLPCGLIFGSGKNITKEDVLDSLKSIIGKPVIEVYDFKILSEGNLYACNIRDFDTSYSPMTFLMSWYYFKK